MPGMPTLTEMLSQGWLIDCRTRDAWAASLAASLKSGGAEALVKMSLMGEGGGYEPPPLIQDGYLAIVRIEGALMKTGRYTMLYSHIRERVSQALAASWARAVLLDIDSPGGAVNGLTDLAEYLGEAAGQKPFYAYANGQATSAAYWIATKAAEIAASDTTDIGSIGVRAEHWDWSGFLENFGVKITDLYSGEYKAAGAANAPLSERDRDYFQASLDSLRALFVNAVSTARGLDARVVHDTEARVYLAAEAKSLGLIDHVMSRDKFISYIKEETLMDLKTLKAEHKGLYDEAVAEATRGMIPQASADEQIAQAKKDEAARVLGLAGSMLDEKTASAITALVATGATPEQAAAMKAAFAPQAQAEPQPEGGEAAAKAKILDGIQAAASQPLAPAAGGQDQDFDALVTAHMKEVQCTKADAVRAVAKANPKAHEAWVAAKNK